MPRVEGILPSGIKPHQKASEIMKLNKPVTPTEIDSYVGMGKYSSKYICFLKHEGYQFSVQKDGKSVVSYTPISIPSNTTFTKNNPKPDQTRTIKVGAVKKLKKSKIENYEPMKYENNIENSYTVDGDFDSVEIDDLF